MVAVCTEELDELRKKEKEMGYTPDWELDAFMKAEIRKGKKDSIVTDLVIKLLGLDVSVMPAQSWLHCLWTCGCWKMHICAHACIDKVQHQHVCTGGQLCWHACADKQDPCDQDEWSTVGPRCFLNCMLLHMTATDKLLG